MCVCHLFLLVPWAGVGEAEVSQTVVAAAVHRAIQALVGWGRREGERERERERERVVVEYEMKQSLRSAELCNNVLLSGRRSSTC